MYNVIPFINRVTSTRMKSFYTMDLPVDTSIPIESMLSKKSSAVKRTIDIAGASVGLLLTLPLWMIIALVIKTTSKGPVFFRQERIGIGGSKFYMYKFRTMFVDAEERLHELMKHNERKGPAFKMKNDPRVTQVGRFLRQWSLDELPQFWNVLIGDMSLIGPRPPIMSEVKQYKWWQRKRLDAKPGITGLWQVKARHKPDFDSWARLDIKYIRHQSLWMDISILLETLPAVLYKSRGC